jgi:hypothetical protein
MELQVASTPWLAETAWVHALCKVDASVGQQPDSCEQVCVTPEPLDDPEEPLEEPEELPDEPPPSGDAPHSLLQFCAEQLLTADSTCPVQVWQAGVSFDVQPL